MKPKQQTKQQLMEKQIDDLQLTVSEQHKENERLTSNLETAHFHNERSEIVNERLNKSLDRAAIIIVVGIILSFAGGLYTGHKITQRAKPEKIYVGSDYRTGYETGFKSALKENTINTYANGYTDGFRDGNLGNKSKALNWQPKTGKVIYRPIHHIKGAERLRL